MNPHLLAMSPLLPAGRDAIRRVARSCLCLLPILSACFLAGCHPSPGRASLPLSEDAARAARLLDAGSYDAATEVLKESLGRSKTDPGVLIQYARCLILSRDPAYPNFILSPLVADGRYYWAFGIAKNAVKLAIELDPECKAFAADVVFHAFEKRAIAAFEEGRGCIGQPQSMYYPETGMSRRASGLELSMINIAWSAIETDAATALAWVPRYQRLVDIAVERGKVASAMMLGNLCGDMRQGGRGAEDFIRANRALLDSLEHYQPDPQHNFLQASADEYPACFRDELLADAAAIDPLFAKLENKLAEHGVSIPRPARETPRTLVFPSGAPP